MPLNNRRENKEATQKDGETMRALMIMFDTLTRSFLPNYGNDWVQAPNFERLREKTVTFANFYGGSMPCMPARRELHTGRYNFLHRGWGPLESFDNSVFERLQEKGVYCHLVTDHSHYFEDGGATYHNRYSTWEGFRGQEGDRWVPRSQAMSMDNQNPFNKTGISAVQHYANRTRQVNEEDMSSVQTIQAGLDFLAHHHDKDNWFLQMECFDPHEPFYVPEKYRQLYDCKEDKDIPFWPKYQKIDSDSNHEQIDGMRKEYAALLSMCDYHLGRVLDFLDDHNMWEDTLVIVNTDHGFLLGEHDWLGKNIAPMYEEIIHLPFFMHIPGEDYNDGKVYDGLCQTVDIAATLLDYFNISDDYHRDGRSLISMIKEEMGHHAEILFGVNGGHVGVYDGRYVYMRSSAKPDNGPLVNQTLAMTRMRGFFTDDSLSQVKLVPGNRFTNGMPVLQLPVENYINSYGIGNLLFDMKKDPKQENPLTDPEIEKAMIEKLVKKMKEIEAPLEEFERLGLIKK
ncbi:sulfatase-like hydrolase/transferase [Paenibacillus macerans]|nr:sulfatase-like hydrolase/transferase [Paenibacillus macerans]